MTVESKKENFVYIPLNGFTTVDIGCKRGNNAYNFVTRLESPNTANFLQTFNSLWNDEEIFNVFSEFLEDISEDVLPNEATGFKRSKVTDCAMMYYSIPIFQEHKEHQTELTLKD